MDKFKIALFLICCTLLNVSCNLERTSDNQYANEQNSDIAKLSASDLDKIYQAAADSIMSYKRFHVCMDSFPKEINGKITVICQVHLDSNLYVSRKNIFIRYKRFEKTIYNTPLFPETSTPIYKELHSSQEEFTDSILKRVNNLSLLNLGRLHNVDDSKQYIFAFVYYLIDCNEENTP